MHNNASTSAATRLSLGEASNDSHWRLGILLRPLLIRGRLQGEAGQPVRYREAESGIEVVVGVLYLARTVPTGWVIPYHPNYSPSRVYLMLTRKRRVLGTLGSDRSSYLLAWNVAREFPDHPLHENLLHLACELAEACESSGSGKFPHTRFLINQYFRAYPQGRYRDRLEWLNLRIRMRRDSGGDPREILEAFHRYLMTHPQTAWRDEIKLAMARLYRMAAERMQVSGEFHLADRYLRRARHIYRGLCEHPEPEVEHTARVALFELEHLSEA